MQELALHHTDVWRNHLFPMCDLMSLIRLSWTCGSLRRLLQRVDTVTAWQDACWYMERECRCSRNLYYLKTPEYCSFSYDWNASSSFTSQRDSDQVLRRYGRALQMYLQTDVPNGAEPLRVPFLDPQKDYLHFRAGVYQTRVESLIVPMPRMLSIPVENVPNIPPMNHPITLTETHEAYMYRMYWKTCHEVRPQNALLGAQHVAHTEYQPWSTMDRVDAYLERCQREGRDPYDPMDDPDCDGYLAGSWARRCMHQTAVGLQHYPLELCLSKDDLEPPKARQEGVDYLERIFLPIVPLSAYPCTGMLLEHRGITYFHGVRYENETGDFVNWALSTHTLLHGFYRQAWLECAYHFMTQLYQTMDQLAVEIEGDLCMARFCKRWMYLEHLQVCTRCFKALEDKNEEEATMDREGVAFLRETPQYGVYHNVLRHMVREDEDLRRRCQYDTLNDETYAYMTRQYLHALLPQRGFATSHRRNETQMMIEIHYLLEAYSYMVRFGRVMVRGTSRTTFTYRTTTLRVYLATGFGMLAFAPGWHTAGSGGAVVYHHRPSRTQDRVSALTVPCLNLTWNHRYGKYLRFLTARSTYYDDHFALDQPTPQPQQQAQQTTGNQVEASSSSSMSTVVVQQYDDHQSSMDTEETASGTDEEEEEVSRGEPMVP